MAEDKLLMTRGALAAAKIALNTFTNTSADVDSQKRMVFRISPADFLLVREIEKMVDHVLGST